MTFDDDAAAVRRLLRLADPARPVTPGEVAAARQALGARLGRGVTVPPAPLRRTRRRIWRVAAPLAAAAALLVGLLVVQPFSRSTPVGAAVMQAAATATEQAGTAQLAAVVQLGGQTVTVDGAGSFDGRSAALTAHLPAPLGDVRLIGAGDDLYVSAPAALEGLVGDHPWIHIGRATLDQLGAGAGLDGLGASVAFDPTAALAYVRSVTDGVHRVGEATLRGDHTVHYAGTISPSRLAAQLPEGPDRDALSRAAAAAGQDIPVDVWIDDQGRLRKLTLSVDLSRLDPAGRGAAAAPGLSGTATADLEVWDYGTTIDTSAPPSDQVTELSGLLPLLGQLVGHR